MHDRRAQREAARERMQEHRSQSEDTAHVRGDIDDSDENVSTGAIADADYPDSIEMEGHGSPALDLGSELVAEHDAGEPIESEASKPCVAEPAVERAWRLARSAEELSRVAFAPPADKPAEVASSRDLGNDANASESDANVSGGVPDVTETVTNDTPGETPPLATTDAPAASAPFGTPWIGDGDPLEFIADDFEQLYAIAPARVRRLLSALSTCDAVALAKLFGGPAPAATMPSGRSGEPVGKLSAPPALDVASDAEALQEPLPTGVPGATEAEMIPDPATFVHDERGRRVWPVHHESVFPRLSPYGRGSWRSR
jgi:hypothetical protein